METKGLSIETGICGDEQESSFMNATLQSHEGLEFSIATHIDVPPDIKTEEDLARHLDWVCRDVLERLCGISFEVQIGPAGSGPDEEDDDDV